jgi:2-keto-4-pentenoate hydratase/2-oxohepta-3-ene-1,7-dioic acid hydratase in catechol pathway
VKILRFDDWQTGLLVERTDAPQVLDIAKSLPALRNVDVGAAGILALVFERSGIIDWAPMIDDWARVGKALHTLHAAGAQPATKMALHPLASVKLQAPLPSPHARIWALGGNVATHQAAVARKITGNQSITVESVMAEKASGMPPWGFLVLPETVVGPDAKVAPPAGIQKFDYEAEVAVILSGGGLKLRPEDVKVWGITAWNDLSIRDGRLGIGPALHRGAFNWAVEKNFETGNACGPWVVVDEQLDPMRLRVQIRVSGETRQDWSTSEMMYSFGETAAFLSGFLRLKSGDIVCSGTGHGTAAEYGRDGDRWLKPGDRLEVEVEGVGILRNEVVRW